MKIIGMMPVYNESDIIGQSVAHMISQGIPLVVLDSSTDGSYEIISEFLGKGVISIERLHAEKYEEEKILRMLCQMATAQNPDWGVICDADEFLESPQGKLTLKEAIDVEDAQGYNMIQFDNFEFMLTEFDSHSDKNDVRKRIRYYTWHDDFRFRAFKFYPGTTIDEHGGHFPNFPIDIEVKISPNKFVLRHYRFRSYEHGLKKVFEERVPRYSPGELNKGWHVHYKNFRKDERYFVVDSKKLTRYDEDGRWDSTKKFDPSFGAWTAEGPLSETILLHRKLDERTAWAHRLKREMMERDERILKLQKEFDERTGWALRLDREVKERDEKILELQKELAGIRETYWYKLARLYKKVIDRVRPRHQREA